MKWECDRCGQSMMKNTTECPGCGYTIHSAATSGESLLGIFGGGQSPPSRPASTSAGGWRWRCTKCDHVHKSKPFTCHECGSSWF